MANSTVHIPLLESGNFGNWLFRVEIALDEKNIRDAIKAKVESKEANKLREDAKARNLIIQALPDKYLEYVKDEPTAYDMIEKLKSTFVRKSTLSTIHLKKQLMNLKCKKGQSIQEHLNNFERLTSDIEAHGTKIEEKEKICQLLISVEEAYQPLVTALEMSNMELTIDFIKEKLLDAELKENSQRRSTSSRNPEYVFHSTMMKCYNCGEPNHFARNCPKNSSSRNQYYNKQPIRGRGNFRGRISHNRVTRNQNVSHIAHESENQNTESTVSFIAAQANTAPAINSHENNVIKFIIDSGASHHMISNKYINYIENIQEISPIKIQIANGNIITTNKKGNIIGTSGEGIEITIEDCLIMEQISHNLLSVVKLNKKGLKVVFDKSETVITNGAIRVYGENDGKLCTLKMNLIKKEALVAKKTESDLLWHRRMGHLNYGGMKILELPLSNEKCTICMEAKACRSPFNDNPVPRTKRIGQLVYCDIGGPVTPATQEDEKYYLTIIDDYSHFMEVHLLHSKNEAKNYIMRYVKIMKNNGINIGRIRTDRGGEFINDELALFYEEQGIIQEKTCAYSPQQNSICERMNLTLLNKVRAMLLETNIPKYLWGEAIRCAAYIINRSPTKALRGDIPARIWYGKYSLDKLRVFGAKAWSVILPRPGKLEPRAKSLIMIGYCGSGYRLWDPKTNEIIESRDVRFDESSYRYEDDKVTHTIHNEENEEEELSITKDSIQDMTNKDMTEEPAEGTKASQEQQRDKREIKLPKKYEDYHMTNIAYAFLSEDPISYNEAIQKEGWPEAIEKELEAHEKLRTWEECDLPKGHKAIDTKWVFRTKADNTMKARLVAKGFQEETTQNVYAPVARITTVRLFLNKAVQENLNIKQLDIPTAFLNGELNTDIYIKYPEGVQKKQEGKVLKLRKALYGLKEAPRCWNEKLNRFLTENALKQSQSDFCLYTGTNIYILIFVDDILVIGDGQNIIQKLKEEFQAKDMGNISKFLGMEITQSKDGMEIKQKQIIEKILFKFNMHDCKGCNTPMEVGLKISEDEEVMNNIPYRELIGSLMYLATISRPDIAYATGFLSRYMNCPTPTLWKAAKRILRYLKQTKEKGLVYKKENTNNLIAFSDSDWGSEPMDRRSVSGVAIFHRGNLVSWSSKKQSSVSLSTAESEYYAASLSRKKRKKRKRNREYQRAWRQRKKALKKKVSKEEKEEEKRKRHRESQRAYYQRIKGLKGNDKNVEQLSQKKLDDLQMKRKKLDSNEDQENVVQCKASQNLENVQLEQNQFLTQQLRTYEESHERITPKVILHRITDIPVADVRRKWSHVRNSYSRHLRNEVSGARTGRGRAVSRWYLADELAFLRDHMATDVRPSYAAFGPSFLEEGGAEVDVKPFASPWLLPRAELKPDALNDDSSSSHAGFTPDDNCSYFQFFKGIYNDYQELPSKKQRLFKRQCLNLLHDLLDDEEVPMIPECIQTFSDGPYSDDPVNLSGAGSDEERERKPKISDLTILPS